MNFFFTHTNYAATREHLFEENRGSGEFYDRWEREEYYASRMSAEELSEEAKCDEIQSIIRGFNNKKDLQDYIAKMNSPPYIVSRLMNSAHRLK